MARKINELFYDLRMRTEGLKKDLDESERHLTKFSSFVTNNTGAALAAFGVAALAAGAKVTAMAAEFDQAMRGIAGNLPTGMAGIQQLRKEIEALSVSSGRATSEMLSAATQIAKGGVANAAEVRQRLEAAALVADATGTELSTVVAGLDQVMDAFGVSADQAKKALADMFVANRGRGSFDELFEAFKAVTARSQDLGLSLSDTTKALVVLLDRGLQAKNIRTFFAEHTAEQIREIGENARSTAGSVAELEEAANLTREGAERLNQSLHNELHATLVELGNKGLPLVNGFLSAMLELLDHNSAAAKALARDMRELAKVGQEAKADPSFGRNSGRQPLLSTVPLRITGRDRAIDDLVTRQLATFRDRGAAMFDGASNLEELRNMRAAITRIRQVDPKRRTKEVTDYLAALNAAIVAIGETTEATAGAKPKPLSAEEIKRLERARQSLRDEVESAIAGMTPGKEDDRRIRTAKIARQAKEAQMSPAETQELLGRFNDALKDDDITKALGPVLQEIDAGITRVLKQIRPFDDPEVKRESDRIAAEITRTLADDMQQKLDQDLGRMLHTATPEARDAWAAHQGALITVQPVKETVEDRLGRVDQLPDRLAKMKELRALDEELVKGAKDLALAAGDQNQKADASRILSELALRIQQKRTEVTKEEAKAQDAAAKSLKERTHRLASDIEAAASFAYGLAQAFGSGNQELLNMITAVGQVAAGVSKITSTDWSKMKLTDKLGAVGAIAGGAIAIGKALFGGESAEERRRREQSQVAITRMLDVLARDISGTGGTLAAQRADKHAEFADKRNQIEEQLAGKKNEAARNRALRELALLEGKALEKVDREFARSMKEAQEDYEVRRLRATGHDAEAEALARTEAAQRELAEAEKNGADEATKLALQLTLTAEAAQAAAEAERKVREKRLEDVGTEIEIMDITDPGQQLARRAEVMKSFGGSLAGILEGLDLTNPDDVAKLDQRVKELFIQLENAPDSVDLAGLSIGELIQYLLELDGAADAVAAGVKTAADAFNEAVNTLSVDAEIAGTTDPTQFAQGVAGAAGGSFAEIGAALAGIDLSTPEGRARAEAALQELYASNKSNKPLVDAIRQVLKAVRAVPVPEAPPEEVAARATSAGGRESIASAARGVTEAVGNRMADYLQAIEIGVQELPDALAASLSRFLTPVVTGPVFPPPLPAQGGAGASARRGAGSDGVVITIQNFIQLEAPDGQDARVWGDQAGQSIGEAINRQLADWFRGGQIRAGNLDRVGVS